MIGDKNIEHQISAIAIFGNEQVIYGVQASYTSNNEQLEGTCQIDQELKDIAQK